MKTLILSTVLCMAPLTAALAATCSIQSPPHTVALLELYTSEGCSSCPPADEFVSRLRADPGLGASRLVPLSLHVDYWDYIGWNDVYAKPAFTERQRWLSALAKTRTIYTPEIFIAGKELRAWRTGLSERVKRINQGPAQAGIGITLGKINDGKLPVEVSADTKQRARLFIALYQNGLVSNVKAGENRGVTLRHDFVVRELDGPLELAPGAAGAKTSFARMLSVPSGSAGKNLGVAAFVQTDQGDVLQAVALPVCDG